MVEKHPDQIRLEYDLDRLKLRPSEKEIIVDLFGWNNRDRTSPKSYWAFRQGKNFASLLLLDAMKSITKDMPFWAVSDALSNLAYFALFLMIAGLEKSPHAEKVKEEIDKLAYRPPEVWAGMARSMFQALIEYRIRML